MRNVIDCSRKIRKHGNPSFPIAPHCTIKPRYCFCLQKDGLMRCEAKNYKESCAESLITLVLKFPDKNRPRHLKYAYLTEAEQVSRSPSRSD